MSGKNYENARLLLTPVEPLERAELFFKMMYELKDGNWDLRKNDDQTRNNFLSGKGAGWLTVDQDNGIDVDPARAVVGVYSAQVRIDAANNLNKKEGGGATHDFSTHSVPRRRKP